MRIPLLGLWGDGGYKRKKGGPTVARGDEEAQEVRGSGFKTISLPAGLVDRAEALATAHPALGYTSKTRLVEDGVRRFIESLEERVRSSSPAKKPDERR